jgi:hypothetical protein
MALRLTTTGAEVGSRVRQAGLAMCCTCFESDLPCPCLRPEHGHALRWLAIASPVLSVRLSPNTGAHRLTWRISHGLRLSVGDIASPALSSGVAGSMLVRSASSGGAITGSSKPDLFWCLRNHPPRVGGECFPRTIHLWELLSTLWLLAALQASVTVFHRLDC